MKGARKDRKVQLGLEDMEERNAPSGFGYAAMPAHHAAATTTTVPVGSYGSGGVAPGPWSGYHGPWGNQFQRM